MYNKGRLAGLIILISGFLLFQIGCDKDSDDDIFVTQPNSQTNGSGSENPEEENSNPNDNESNNSDESDDSDNDSNYDDPSDLPSNDGIRTYLDFENESIEMKVNHGGMDYKKVENPEKSDVNNSDSCGRITITDTKWDILYSNKFEKPFDFSKSTIFKIKIYTSIPTSIIFKLEDHIDNNKDFELSKEITQTDEWVELSFDFEEVSSLNYNLISIVFDSQNTNPEGTYWYFDDIIGPQLQE